MNEENNDVNPCRLSFGATKLKEQEHWHKRPMQNRESLCLNTQLPFMILCFDIAF